METQVNPSKEELMRTLPDDAMKRLEDAGVQSVRVFTNPDAEEPFSHDEAMDVAVDKVKELVKGLLENIPEERREELERIVDEAATVSRGRVNFQRAQRLMIERGMESLNERSIKIPSDEELLNCLRTGVTAEERDLLGSDTKVIEAMISSTYYGLKAMFRWMNIHGITP